jgi:hypothetical protein
MPKRRSRRTHLLSIFMKSREIVDWKIVSQNFGVGWGLSPLVQIVFDGFTIGDSHV